MREREGEGEKIKVFRHSTKNTSQLMCYIARLLSHGWKSTAKLLRTYEMDTEKAILYYI